MLSAFSAPVGRGRGAARLAAVTLAAALVAAGALTGAGRAAADDGTVRKQGGATATIGGLKTYGAAVIRGDEGDQEISAGLFEMSVDGGGTLQTYCVDLYNPTRKGARYHETPWSGTSLGANKDAGRIRWILQNSYPQVNDLAALADRAGVRGGLTEQDAAVGTQVAIWRYSDGADVEAVDPQAERLADYLEKNARSLAEPKAALSLDPPALSGHPGERLGPVTVHTGVDRVRVTPPADAAMSGVRIVDEDGKDVTSAADGGQVYFDVPEDAVDGTAELTVQASTTVPVGRAFASESRSQTQILAGSSESTVSATAGATWAKTGAIPALSAVENCAEGGVDLTVVNGGDEAFGFELLGIEYTIGAGESRTVTVPLQEDQAYDFTIEGPGGFAQRFTGVLDCMTHAAEAAAAETDGLTTQTLAEPSPATAGNPAAGTNLAATGSSDATAAIAGTAIGLLLLGGTALVIARKRKPSAQD
ncbi:Cys-Gln thioester bond-forming surface protein [Streptomyces sp. TRM68416]|uniref:Cys-Gln thioester bond-forming surface protein n=1 Tax=Streptomyces sp. TRM68416 TaxID=2758412 RepID=UPI001661C185|nr:Cys-Gln thioester bond-forming surface protein [Streptomyces sp. TRM68416]MBD0844386.1 Cys-Gln thioester bond-forming surface protein [Streptomyces sp. TRM68416]